MSMYILKIHTDYGYEGTNDYNLVVSSSKERLETLAKDFLEKLPKIKKKITLDIAEWDYEDGLNRTYPRDGGGMIKYNAFEKIKKDSWLYFQGDSALDFLEVKENWDVDCSEFEVEEVGVV